MAKVKISISIDEDLYAELQKIAKKEDRSISQQINKLIRDLVREKGRK